MVPFPFLVTILPWGLASAVNSPFSLEVRVEKQDTIGSGTLPINNSVG